MNEIVALICAGLRKIELEKPIIIRRGNQLHRKVISQEEADREASLSYDQALEYIEENVK